MGLVATAATLAIYLLGGFDWLEYRLLDLRFRYANSTPESPELVCIDIDDGSIDRIGRWPWPRDLQAQILAVLTEAGARAVLVDIEYREPEPLRTVVPGGLDITSDLLTLAEDASIRALPDLELQTAIATADNVYLAFNYGQDLVQSERPVERIQSAAFRHLVARMDAGDSESARKTAQQLWSQPAEVDRFEVPFEFRLAQVYDVLRARPLAPLETLSGGAPLAALLGGPGVDERLRRARRAGLEACRALALQHWLRAWFAAEPERWVVPPHRLLPAAEAALAALGDDPATQPERMAAALRHVLNDHFTTTRSALSAPNLAAHAPEVDTLHPVYFRHADVARRCGFVVFQHDRDNVVRRMRLLVQHEGRLMPQLAFVLAMDVLGAGPEHLRQTGRTLWLDVPGQASRRLTLGRHGHVLMPWVPQQDWTRQFGEHVPADLPLSVHLLRQRMDHNRRELLAALRTVQAAGQLLAQADFAQDLADALNLPGRLRYARYAGEAAAAQQLADAVREYERFLSEDAPLVRAAAVAALADTPAERADEELHRALDTIVRACDANAALAAETRALLERLRDRVAGRICLLGYTATALADMAPIPTHPRAPGVLAHANLLNGLLVNRLPRIAPPGLNILLTLGAGLFVTLASSTRRPVLGVAAVAAGVLATLGGAGWAAFYFGYLWIAITPLLATLGVTFVAILLFRYVFLERESRQIARALGQYTSATLARKMAEDAELCKRAETRAVSAMFTDLAGFTALSERIGAERTQRVLNLTLGRLSDAIMQHEGMINKFMGDGIFAFWNPVIYPQQDHARRACEAALDLQVALTALITEQRATGGDESFAQLYLRIGVATGNAVVGPCGSEHKYDYTCIGDSVNVAARLESANKFYGTRILISGATFAQTADLLAVRPLGGVRVKGKQQGVPIYELLGRRDQVPTDILEYADRFAAAVTAFTARDWDTALAGFEACCAARPDDRAAHEYCTATRALRAAPPPADWSGALELTEK